jgi:hypothetical protein
MNRQLRANGGIMEVTPRENFGLGSKLKKFVRKIIPNEVADIAVKAAPFVAPFNPALAAGMSGLGTFDQTGSISAGLKSGAMNYGGGQLARYVGGAGFQGNPFGQGGAFTGSGFKSGFSSPLGNDTGLGKFFSNRGTDAIQPVSGGEYGQFTEPTFGAGDVLGGEMGTTGAGTVSGSTTGSNSFTEKAFNLLKKGTKAAFYNGDKLDRAAVIGAATAAASYAEALYLASQAGVDLTEEEYDEAQRAEKKEEYAGYLTNFFGSKKDGGRIGYEQGANELMSDITMRGEMDIDDLGIRQQPSTVLVMIEGPSGVEIKEVLESDARRYNLNIVSDSGEFADKGSEIDFSSLGKKDGGRINRRLGSPEKGEGDGLMEMLSVEVDAGGDEEEENMTMAYSDVIFNRREKGALFRSLGDPRMQQTTKSFKDLDNILKHPGMFPEDEFMLKEFLKLKGYKDGGRIGYKDGTGSSNRVAQLMLERDYLLSKDEDVSFIDLELERDFGIQMKAEGGIMEAKVPTGQMRKNNAGVAERDYRQTGGFVPVGIKERADDVPAMLSKNEFVMTADAVRGIGNGDVEEGSKKLYNTMKQAEQVGKA